MRGARLARTAALPKSSAEGTSLMERREFMLTSTLSFLFAPDAQAAEGDANIQALHAMRLSIATPKDFGAVGDGAADHTDAVIRALRTGNVLIVPPGRYRLTSRVHISRGAVLFFLGGEFVLATGATLIVEGHVCAPPVPIIRLAGGAVSGSPQNAAIDVDWFGADTTGSIPCDEAIASALRLAISPRPPRGARQLRFGPGTYRVTRNSIFMPGAAPEPVVGLSICGAGAETTAIVLSPAEEGAHYFFATPRDVICARTWSIRDISLEADTSSPFASAVNGFLFGRDYNFSYQNVQVRVPGTVWHVAGTHLGSKHRFINCFLSGHRVVLLDNQQAVNTQCPATASSATGPLLDVRRGGLISWIGGSIALLGKDPAGSFLRTEEQGFAGSRGD